MQLINWGQLSHGYIVHMAKPWVCGTQCHVYHVPTNKTHITRLIVIRENFGYKYKKGTDIRVGTKWASLPGTSDPLKRKRSSPYANDISIRA